MEVTLSQHGPVDSECMDFQSKFLTLNFSCYLEETAEDTSFLLGFSPIDTGMPDGLLMLRNCFLDFAVEH